MNGESISRIANVRLTEEGVDIMIKVGKTFCQNKLERKVRLCIFRFWFEYTCCLGEWVGFGKRKINSFQVYRLSVSSEIVVRSQVYGAQV